MLKKIYLFLFLLAPSFVISKESKDIFSEVREIKNLLENHQSQISKQAKLNQNLMSALKTTIRRKFADYESILKDLNPDTIQYQQSDKDSFIYYVKYKNLYSIYFFINDPKLFLQFPIEEKTYEKPSWMKLGTAATQPEEPKKETTENSNQNDTNPKTE